MNMNNIVLLYIKNVLNRLLSVQEELTGGGSTTYVEIYPLLSTPT